MLPRVKSVSYLAGYRLELRFTDQSEGLLIFSKRSLDVVGFFNP